MKPKEKMVNEEHIKMNIAAIQVMGWKPLIEDRAPCVVLRHGEVGYVDKSAMGFGSVSLFRSAKFRLMVAKRIAELGYDIKHEEGHGWKAVVRFSGGECLGTFKSASEALGAICMNAVEKGRC